MTFATGCISPATVVHVQIDTDAPITQELTFQATLATRDGSQMAQTPRWIRGGPRGAVTLPASFSLVPGQGPRDAAVTLFVDATLTTPSVGTAPAVTLTFRRTAQFEFRPREGWRLRVFIATQCFAQATGCTGTSACTVAARCQERGLTCGDEGQCVAPSAELEREDGDVFAPPLRDAAPPMDTSVDLDARDVATMDEEPTSAPEVSCPSGVACGTSCVSLSDDPRHCGRCDNACPVGQGCVGAMCTACIPPNTMCDAECANTLTNIRHCGACGAACPTGASCTAGVCRCRLGESVCNGACRLTGGACSVGVGACQRPGLIICTSTGLQCSATAGAPQAEVCNGRDDNCDGTVDEDPACIECLTLPTVTTIENLTLTRGDREFEGHGPDVRLSVNYAIVGSQVQAQACVTMTETQSDWTTGTGCRTVLSAAAATPIDAVLDVNYLRTYRDSNHSCDVLAAGPGVSSATCIGDTSGDDVCVGAFNCGSTSCASCQLRMSCVRVRRRGM
ncbi:MAG: hypothetical protein Q8Q09_02085 [Deltaproteobacteria bacterium]|nr:hypothetical protein [Deltaproteobacteria bacterium]